MLLAALCLAPFFFGASSASAKLVVTDSYRLYENLPYGPSLGVSGQNLVDLYRPVKDSAEPRPVVVWVHGGGWYQGSKRSAAMEKAGIFLRQGYLFAAVNYRLSPRVKANMTYRHDRIRHPAAVADTARAVAWLSARASGYGGDGRRIILIGHSAGAQIVSMLGTDSSYLRQAGMDPARLRGVIALDPVGLDLGRVANAPEKADEDSAVTQRKMIWNAFATPWEPNFETIIRDGSPVNHADPGDPPFLTFTSSTSAIRVREGRGLARLLGQQPAIGGPHVNLGHRDINLRFGTGRYDYGMTRRAFRFARWTASGRSALTVVRGPRVYRLKRQRGRVRVRLKLDMYPRSGFRGICRVNRGIAFRCGSRLRMRAARGTHRVAVRAMDPTGRFGRLTAFRFKVLPPAGR